MATKSISQLDTQATANETDLFEVAIVDANSASGYASKKESAAAIADAMVGEYQYPLRITGTTAKTIAGAINELKSLVDLLPQFAIEVVQTLPVSDISETTIYLVPTQDPEQGNYYEEYIYVNQTWELVGTTAVDLSAYYTSAQVDTLLAAKANTSSLATVATSGAYSDLSGKPTIDTALNTTSTNAVENRAVASEINSIKSDITVEGSASGDIATFVDGSANPLKELEISIEAVQSGSGDPSPQNERPINGFIDTNIYVTNKNLIRSGYDAFNVLKNIYGENIITLDTENKTAVCNFSSSSLYLGVLQRDNTPNTSINRTRLNYYPFKENTQYTFIFKCSSTTPTLNIAVSFTDGTNTGTFNMSQINADGYIVYTSPSNKSVKSLYVGQYSGVSTFYYETFGVYEGVVTYEQHIAQNGTKTNIDWQSVAGTVYGGTINPLTGVLTVTHTYENMSDAELYVSNESYKIVRKKGLPAAANVVGGKNAKCNITNLFGNVSSSSYNNTKLQFSTNSNSYFYMSMPIDFDPGDVYFCYELATPITYQLTPTEVRSLLGINNVWADCGDITELKYTRDLNLCINDIIARIEALENASSNRSLSLSPTLTKSIVSDSDKTEGKTEETEEETKEEAQNER